MQKDSREYQLLFQLANETDDDNTSQGILLILRGCDLPKPVQKIAIITGHCILDGLLWKKR